ncbi:hypothetical protein [Microvirga splendida]|uniref:Uncharacterized protein n=1 Tax=Microvirga splendida TaxID=2795727 RepID=A0ABS0XW74_9HYPH|nr:hypothetical protein [Microvirga splendida]MBJ6124035.1 hypothetical protein [Microvirga splendida]
MKTLTLVFDERELSTLRAALLLLQEQIDVLPEDLAEMLQGHGHPVTAAEIDFLAKRLDIPNGGGDSLPDKVSSKVETLVRIDRSVMTPPVAHRR